jgi:hypothetical protein
LKKWLFELPHGFSLWINEKALSALAKKFFLNFNDENSSYPLVKGAKLTLFLKEWLFELTHGFNLWINEKVLSSLAKKIIH